MNRRDTLLFWCAVAFTVATVGVGLAQLVFGAP
jgi:hypothetical protein